MKTVRIMVAVGLALLGGRTLRAGEAPAVPGTAKLMSVPADAAPACCAAPACAKHERSCLDCLCNWLHYKPRHCGCHCAVSTCWPPLYTWFVDMCPAGGCGHAGPGPCAGGCCGAPAH
jgi:hypothetical protein